MCLEVFFEFLLALEASVVAILALEGQSENFDQERCGELKAIFERFSGLFRVRNRILLSSPQWDRPRCKRSREKASRSDNIVVVR